MDAPLRLPDAFEHTDQQAAAEPQPFEIRVSDDDLQDLRYRLERTRWPDTNVDNADWSYGAETGYIKELAEFWRVCDWRAQEDYLNGGLGCGAQPEIGASAPEIGASSPAAKPSRRPGASA